MKLQLGNFMDNTPSHLPEYAKILKSAASLFVPEEKTGNENMEWNGYFTLANLDFLVMNVLSCCLCQ